MRFNILKHKHFLRNQSINSSFLSFDLQIQRYLPVKKTITLHNIDAVYHCPYPIRNQIRIPKLFQIQIQTADKLLHIVLILVESNDFVQAHYHTPDQHISLVVLCEIRYFGVALKEFRNEIKELLQIFD